MHSEDWARTAVVPPCYEGLQVGCHKLLTARPHLATFKPLAYMLHCVVLCYAACVLCIAGTQRADEYADPKGDVLLTAQQGDLQFGLWVNTAKNPRFKLVDLAGLGMTVEIPKQLALANIALRVEVSSREGSAGVFEASWAGS